MQKYFFLCIITHKKLKKLIFIVYISEIKHKTLLFISINTVLMNSNHYEQKNKTQNNKQIVFKNINKNTDTHRNIHIL